MPTMARSEMLSFLRRPIVAMILSTLGTDSTIHSAPLWFEYDNGVFYMWVDKDSLKVRDIEQNRHASLCIATVDEPYQYVSVQGTCELTREDLERRAQSICERYYGSERAMAFVKDELARTATVLVELSPERLRTESDA